MGWTVENFAGQQANGPDGNWRVAMFELCRAVNERDACVNAGGSGKTLFYKADGTEAYDLTYSDFLGMDTTGTNSLVELNLKRIQARIKALALFATESSGYSDLLGVAGLEAAIGSTFLTEPTKATHAAYWQQLKDALDVLIHFRRGADIGSPEITATKLHIYTEPYFFDGGPYQSSLEDAWDNMSNSGDGTGLGSWLSSFLGVNAIAYGGTGYVSTAQYSAEFDITFSAYTGTITALSYNAVVGLEEGTYFFGSNSTTCTLDTPFTISVGSNAQNAPDTAGTHVLFGGVSDVTFGGTETVTWSFSVPSDCPISDPGAGIASGNGWYHRYTVRPGNVVYAYFDIAAHLTDQA